MVIIFFAENNTIILLKYAVNNVYIYCKRKTLNTFIYQYSSWPHFVWDDNKINFLLGKLRYLQGKIQGQMQGIGFSTQEERLLSSLTLDVIKSSEIEGELLNYEQVRSSIARKLGIENAGLTKVDRNIEGVVEMTLDATHRYDAPLNHGRFYSWHAALFPTGWSGLYKIETGMYRSGEMQVVSGAMGKEKIHYKAPSPTKMQEEMDLLLQWINDNDEIDGVLKAAIAHFWFIIIHPFDDGNGRIARALTDLLLARAENTSQRFYSLSNQILTEKKQYYNLLQEVQYSSGDITKWLEWFLSCLLSALQNTEIILHKTLYKATFWENNKETLLNSRQRLMLNKLLDGFDGKLKTSKWAKITKSSPDTALRDIKDLIAKGILKQQDSGGRSTNYELVSV